MPDKKPAKPASVPGVAKRKSNTGRTQSPSRINESSIRGGTVVTNTKPPPGPKGDIKGK